MRPKVPQELSSLHQLTELNLNQNAAADGPDHLQRSSPKMVVTEQACRFLLEALPALKTVCLSVTDEEAAALKTLQEMCIAIKGHEVLRLERCGDTINPFLNEVMDQVEVLF